MLVSIARFGSNFASHSGPFHRERKTTCFRDRRVGRRFPWKAARSRSPNNREEWINTVIAEVEHSSYLVQSCRMIWIAVYLLHKVSHNPQFCVVAGNVDVEILHVIRRTLPPVFAMVGYIIVIRDNGSFAVL